jgi:hypothetical protein
MGHAPIFLVVGLTPGQGGKLRAQVVMKAPDESQAAVLAADLAKETGAAVALSQTQCASRVTTPSIRVLATFGCLLEDCELCGLEGIAPSDWKPSAASAPGRTAGRLPTMWTSPGAAFFGLMRDRGLRERVRISRFVACISAAAIAAFAVSAIAVRASAAQREARLVEMARPSCDHERVTNRELRHFVRYATKTTATKQEALADVLTLCRAKSGHAATEYAVRARIRA